MRNQAVPGASACRGVAWRVAACVTLGIGLIIAGVAPHPSWADGATGTECPATASAMRGHEALRAMAEDGDLNDGFLVLAIGSSSTEGVGASAPVNAYPHQLEVTLERFFSGLDVEVQNAGIGGETADATVARLEQALRQAAKPDLVIWQVGTNDAVRGGDEAQFRALLERGIAASRRASVDLIMLD